MKARVPKVVWQVHGTVNDDHFSGPGRAIGRVPYMMSVSGQQLLR